MAKSTRIIIEELVLPLVESMGYEYVDTEYGKQGKDRVLTIYIDKPDGVLLDDCEAVSRAIEAVLDEADPIAEQYCLCVSSPGLDRPLKTERDFKRSMGKMIDIKLYKPFEGKKEFTGTLSSFSKSTVAIETETEEIVFELSETAKISPHLDF